METKIYQTTLQCSRKCYQCPYASNAAVGDDLEKPEIERGNIYVLTGGEPFENIETLEYAIEELEKKKAYYRIATAGYIDVSDLYFSVKDNLYFLGINCGTDIPLHKINFDVHNDWWKNWKLIVEDERTWMTLTITNALTHKDVLRLIKRMKPKTVLINQADVSNQLFEDYVNIIRGKFKEIKVIEGYKNNYEI